MEIQAALGRVAGLGSWAWLTALTLGLGACAATQNPPDEISEPPAPPRVYSLGVGDVVEIKVFREPDLAGTYRVNPDPIEFPLIGSVQLVGKRPEEVREDLRTRLAAGFLVDPQVTVFVREQNSSKVHVLGQVKKPGTFQHDAGMSVIQAITAAGGFTTLAAKNSVSVTRVINGRKETFRVKAGDIGSGQAQNVELMPGDIVFVPEAIF